MAVAAAEVAAAVHLVGVLSVAVVPLVAEILVPQPVMVMALALAMAALVVLLRVSLLLHVMVRQVVLLPLLAVQLASVQKMSVLTIKVEAALPLPVAGLPVRVASFASPRKQVIVAFPTG